MVQYGTLCQCHFESRKNAFSLLFVRFVTILVQRTLFQRRFVWRHCKSTSQKPFSLLKRYIQTMTLGLTQSRQRTSVAVLPGSYDNHDPATVQAAALRVPDNKYNKKRRGRRKTGSSRSNAQQVQQAQLVGLAVCCVTLFLLARFLTIQHQEKGLHYQRVRLFPTFLRRC